MPNTRIFSDGVYGTHVTYRPNRQDFVFEVSAPTFGKHTVELDFDDCERLLALYEVADCPTLDIADYFGDTFHVYHSGRMADAFITSAHRIAFIVGASSLTR